MDVTLREMDWLEHCHKYRSSLAAHLQGEANKQVLPIMLCPLMITLENKQSAKFNFTKRWDYLNSQIYSNI